MHALICAPIAPMASLQHHKVGIKDIHFIKIEHILSRRSLSTVARQTLAQVIKKMIGFFDI